MPQSPAGRPITPTATSKAVTPPASPGAPAAATAVRKGSKAPSDTSKSNSNDGDGASSAGTSLRSGGGSRGRAYAADGARRSKAPAAKTSKELQEAYPALFNTADMGLTDWWRHRWTATTSIGRLAAVAMIALLVAAALMAAAWAIRDVLHDQRLQRHDHARHITAALLRTQEAVAAERKAALAVSAALWAAASPAQVAAATPPSITAVPSARSLQTAFDAATVVTDTAYNATIAAFIEHAVLMETVVDAAAVTPISRDTRQTTAVRPELAAGDFAHVGTRGTRNPALTSDRERLDDAVATAGVRRQLDSNVRRYPVTGAAKAARVDPRASSFSSFNTGVGGRIDFDAFSSFRVQGLRRAVRPTLGALPVEISMDYGIVEAHLARLAARTVAIIGDADVNELLVASVAAGAASVFADAVSAAREIVDPVFQQTTAPAAYVARATDFVAAADAAETLMDEVLPAVLSADDARRLWLDSNRLVDQRAMRDLRNEVLISVLRPAAGSSLATTPGLANPAGAPAVDALSDALRLHFSIDTYHTAPGTSRYLPLTVTMLLVAGVLCLFVLVEQRHYTRIVIGTQRDRSMENTIAYVAAAGAALRAFDLDAASDIIEERSAEATTSEGLATLHSRLLRCVASVKFAVPTIPALLFPERSAAAASYYAIVRRSTPSGSGGGLMDEARKAAKKRRRQGQAKEAAAAERAAAAAKVRELEEDDEAAGDGSTVPLTKDGESGAGGDAAASDKKSEPKGADTIDGDGDGDVSSGDDDEDDDGGAAGSGKHSTEMLTVGDVHNGQLNDDIWDRVQPGSEVRFAAFMYLDVSSLFEFQSSTDALDVAREYAGLLATAAEEYITLHGGVFHSLQGLTFVGSWGAAPTGDASLPPVPDECEAAARAAYALSARISTWRRQDPKLKEHFVPSIAITAGKVRVAVWNGGAARFSMAQVVGPPLARARAVLRANFHHRTAIAVDDTAADRLALRQLPSKPVELLTTAMREFAKDTATSGGGGGASKEPAASATGSAAGSEGGGSVAVAAAATTTTTTNNGNNNNNNNGTAMLHLAEEDDSAAMGGGGGGGGGSATRKTETDGRAHELISLARHRDPDLPARLAEYKAAFSLYQRGYHAEALKGFRRYTRLYGYDGSVERIQTLILS